LFGFQQQLRLKSKLKTEPETKHKITC